MANLNYSSTLYSLDFSSAIIEYVRDWTGERIGALMAVPDRNNDNRIHIGWSLVRSDSDDKFNKKVALDIAARRAELANVHKMTIPFDIVETGKLDNFLLRCMKYYRSNNVVVFGRVRLNDSLTENKKLEYEEYTVGHSYIPVELPISKWFSYGGTD